MMNPRPDHHHLIVATISNESCAILAANPIVWNPWNKVVQDHRDGTIHHEATNVERAKRGLPVPWVPAFGNTDPFEAGID